MKTLAIVLGLLLVLRHPAAVGAVLVIEAFVCAGIGWLTWRGLRAALLPPVWRRRPA